MQYKNYYQLLGIERSASQEDVKRAYRKLARKYHPDVSKEVDAETKFKEVNEAYEVLGDPEKRAAFDRLGKNWKDGQDFQPPPDWDTNFEFSGGNFSFGKSGDFSDFFEQIFGGGQFGFRKNASERTFDNGSFHQANGKQHGTSFEDQHNDDFHAKINIDIEDSFQGATRSVTLQTPFVDKQGHVSTRPHVLKVKIPKGIQAGQRIRLKGQGGQSHTGKRSDLYLEISFNAHKYYRIQGKDLEMELPITPWEAALGETIRVQTLAGEIELKLPKNASTDQKLRIKGRGLPGHTAKDNGNLVCLLKIKTPPADTLKATAFYEKMRKEMTFNPRSELSQDSRKHT